MGRAVIHIDLDAFFASVEIKKRPELKGKPVVVGADGDPAKRGVVSAATYEARKFGVKAGMSLRQAKKLCPEAVFLPVDFDAYDRESERFMAILREFSPLVESFGLDEAFVEILPIPGRDPFPQAVNLAREMKERVRRELGITASAGVATNKLLAKMASEVKKPDGFFTIEEKEVEGFLRELPVRKLFGVGAKTEKRLKDLGVRTVGELAKTPVQHLERNFGPITGRGLHEHARGVDDSPVVPFYEPESLGREVTFEEDTSDFSLVKETLLGLTQDVVGRLRSMESKGQTITIKIRFNNFKTVTKGQTLEFASDSMNDLGAAVARLLEAIDMARPVRLVGVKVSGLDGRG